MTIAACWFDWTAPLKLRFAADTLISRSDGQRASRVLENANKVFHLTGHLLKWENEQKVPSGEF